MIIIIFIISSSMIIIKLAGGALSREGRRAGEGGRGDGSVMCCTRVAAVAAVIVGTPCGGEVLHVCLKLSRTKHPM